MEIPLRGLGGTQDSKESEQAQWLGVVAIRLDQTAPDI